MKNKVILERRKVVGTEIIEIYKCDIKDSKDEFFKHYKAMQGRGFKNDRSKDKTVNGCLHATFVKNLVANKKKGRA